MDDAEVDRLAEIIWDYHLLHHEMKPADCIFVLGSHDTRVADHAVDLFQQRLAPYIIFSGGSGRLTKDTFSKSEAEVFADIARIRGVPETKILLEDRSTNTGENVAFTKRLLAERGLDFSTFILAQKPYMERRTFATFSKVWPEKAFVVTSPPLTFQAYCSESLPKHKVISIMVGDLQRIREYPARGFQIHQDIPASVWAAYEQLVAMGYTEHLIND